MLQYQPWKVVVVLGICLFGLITALPNVYPPAWRTWLAQHASIIPHKPITLGLDLQGGVYVLFEAEIEVGAKEKLQSLLDEVRKGLRKQNTLYAGLAVQGDSVVVKITDPTKLDAARTFLKGLAQPAGAGFSGVGAMDYDVRVGDDGMSSLTITAAGREQIRTNAMAQSVEMNRALKAQGVPSELHIAPNEGHDWAQPGHQLYKMNTEIGWLEKYARNLPYTPEPAPTTNDPTVVPAP